MMMILTVRVVVMLMMMNLNWNLTGHRYQHPLSLAGDKRSNLSTFFMSNNHFWIVFKIHDSTQLQWGTSHMHCTGHSFCHSWSWSLKSLVSKLNGFLFKSPIHPLSHVHASGPPFCNRLTQDQKCTENVQHFVPVATNPQFCPPPLAWMGQPANYMCCMRLSLFDTISEIQDSGLLWHCGEKRGRIYYGNLKSWCKSSRSRGKDNMLEK